MTAPPLWTSLFIGFTGGVLGTALGLSIWGCLAIALYAASAVLLVWNQK